MKLKSVVLLLFSICSLNAEVLKAYPGVYQLTEPVDHSETPTWDTRNNLLYFVNIHAGQIFRYDYSTRDLRNITLEGTIAPVIPSLRNEFLLLAGLNRSVVAVEWDGLSEPSKTRILTTVSDQFPTSRFNDGKADKNGRLWIGTMGYEDRNGTLTPDNGVFYKVTCSDLVAPQVEIAPVNISNGIAFNAANDKLFYIDTPTRQVAVYDFNLTSGVISNRQVAFDLRNYSDVLTGNPDGMTIDEEDNIWVALYGGGAIVKVNPARQELLQVVPLPARDVTSAIWGGPNLDILYVTTSRYSLTEEQRLQYPAAGAVFAVEGLGTRGRPVFALDLIGSITDVECDGVKK